MVFLIITLLFCLVINKNRNESGFLIWCDDFEINTKQSDV